MRLLAAAALIVVLQTGLWFATRGAGVERDPPASPAECRASAMVAPPAEPPPPEMRGAALLVVLDLLADLFGQE